MAELCPVLEPDPGELSCTSVHEESDTNGCELDQACGRSHEVTVVPGAKAWLMEYGSAFCGRSEQRLPFECSCDVDGVSADYGLLSESGVGACQPFLDFCTSGTTPTYDGPTVCVDTSAEASSSGCQLHRTCATGMRLTDDVSLAKVTGWYSDCTRAEPTGSSCYCSSASETFSFDLEAEPVADTCVSSILNCTNFGNVVPEGEPVCSPTSQTGGDDFCEADLDCRQSATVNGNELVARGRMLVYCRQAAPQQPWWCSCASNQDTARFELGSPNATGWEACTAAATGCLDELPVYIGPYGEFMPPPDPMPPLPE
jgi:hypothetical protein